MYDRPRLTVNFMYSRVVQTGKSLGERPLVAQIKTKISCAAQLSFGVRIAIMDYNQTFRSSFELSKQIFKIYFFCKSTHYSLQSFDSENFSIPLLVKFKS